MPAAYKGSQGVYVESEDGWAWVMLNGSSLEVRGGAYAKRLARCLKEEFLNAYYYSGRGHIYLIYAGEESLTPEKSEGLLRRLARKVAAENMAYLIALSVVLSIAVYSVTGPLLAPITLAAIAIFAITVSPYFLPSLISHWRLGPDDKVTVLDISIPGRLYREIYPRLSRKKLAELKRRVWELLNAGVVDAEKVSSLLNLLFGTDLPPSLLSVDVKTVDVQGALKRVSKAMGKSSPGRVYIYNVLLKNALSIGVGSNSALIVTSGLLVSLEEDELAAVMGHEESHLARGDILLFTLAASLEYAFRLYYFFIYNPILLLNTWLMLGYLAATGTALFLLAKLLELRADVDVAHLGLGGQLADALVKVGYPVLLEEKSALRRLLEWLAWKPHPPLRYRVAAARSFAEKPPRRVWLTAVKLIVTGLLRAA